MKRIIQKRQILYKKRIKNYQSTIINVKKNKFVIYTNYLIINHINLKNSRRIVLATNSTLEVLNRSLKNKNYNNHKLIQYLILFFSSLNLNRYSSNSNSFDKICAFKFPIVIDLL